MEIPETYYSLISKCFERGPCGRDSCQRIRPGCLIIQFTLISFAAAAVDDICHHVRERYVPENGLPVRCLCGYPQTLFSFCFSLSLLGFAA